MYKIIPPDSQDFGEEPVAVVKGSSRGIQGEDLKQFLKRASIKFKDSVDDLLSESGIIPVHVLAIGSTEAYGPNKNGDGFREAVCKKYHSTFVKHARWYRYHIHDKSKSYGFVKASAYNNEMRRIELLVGLFATKAAAEKHGGLVADKEIDKIMSGEQLPVSMGASVPYDVCLVADTPIVVGKGIKFIQDVKPGDCVLTHNRRYCVVEEVYRRHYKGKLYTIYVSGCVSNTTLTDNHPVAVIHNDNLIWKNPKQLAIGDTLVFPIPDGKYSLSAEYAFEAGRKLASNCKRTYCEDLFAYTTSGLYQHVVGIKQKLFEADSKTISILLTSYIQKLGRRARRVGADLEIYFKVAHKAEAVQKLFWKLNIKARVERLRKLYKLVVPNCEEALFMLEQPPKYILLPVEKIEVKDGNCDVYNLQVEFDESYVTTFAVHNCSGCGHKSTKREEYCGPQICKYGGLKFNMGKVFDDGHILHADNPKPTFIDISWVSRNADRTAFVLGVLQKRAAYERPTSTDSDVPAISNKLTITQLKHLYNILTYGTSNILKTAFCDKEFIPPPRKNPLEALEALTKVGAIAPFSAFCKIYYDDNNKASETANLSNIFNILANNLDKVFDNKFMKKAFVLPDMMRWAEQYREAWSIEDDFIIKRAQLGILSPRKNDIIVRGTSKLALDYGLYQLAALSKILGDNFDNTSKYRLINTWNLIQ